MFAEAGTHPPRRPDRDRRAARPSKAPVRARVSLIVELLDVDPGFHPHYTEEYRLPGVGFATHGPSKAQVPYDIPDLSAYGLQLCARVRVEPIHRQRSGSVRRGAGEADDVDADEPAGLQVAGLEHEREAGPVVHLDAGAGRGLSLVTQLGGGDLGGTANRCRDGAAGGGLARPACGRRRLPRAAGLSAPWSRRTGRSSPWTIWPARRDWLTR